jgi:hypothetical protein
MHSPQRALFVVEGNAALNQARVETVLLKLLLAPGPREKASLVGVFLQIHNPNTRQFGWRKFHTIFTFGIGTMNLPPRSR